MYQEISVILRFDYPTPISIEDVRHYLHQRNLPDEPKPVELCLGEICHVDGAPWTAQHDMMKHTTKSLDTIQAALRNL